MTAPMLATYSTLEAHAAVVSIVSPIQGGVVRERANVIRQRRGDQEKLLFEPADFTVRHRARGAELGAVAVTGVNG